MTGTRTARLRIAHAFATKVRQKRVVVKVTTINFLETDQFCITSISSRRPQIGKGGRYRLGGKTARAAGQPTCVGLGKMELALPRSVASRQGGQRCSALIRESPNHGSLYGSNVSKNE